MEMGLSSYQQKKIAGNKTECQHNAICCYVNGTKAIRFHNVFMTIFEFLNEAEQQDSSTIIVQGYLIHRIQATTEITCTITSFSVFLLNKDHKKT